MLYLIIVLVVIYSVLTIKFYIWNVEGFINYAIKNGMDVSRIRNHPNLRKLTLVEIGMNWPKIVFGSLISTIRGYIKRKA